MGAAAARRSGRYGLLERPYAPVPSARQNVISARELTLNIPTEATSLEGNNVNGRCALSEAEGSVHSRMCGSEWDLLNGNGPPGGARARAIFRFFS